MFDFIGRPWGIPLGEVQKLLVCELLNVHLRLLGIGPERRPAAIIGGPCGPYSASSRT